MQLMLLRSCLIIPLLINVIHNEEKVSTSLEKLRIAQDMGHPTKFLEPSKDPHNFMSLSNQQSNARRKRFSKTRQGRKTNVKAVLSNPKRSSTQVLAERLAKEALKSSKMQETFKRLTVVKPDGGKSCEVRRKRSHSPKKSFQLLRSAKVKKGYYKPFGFNNSKRKKRKGPNQQFYQDPCWSDSSSKKASSKSRKEAKIFKRKQGESSSSLIHSFDDPAPNRESEYMDYFLDRNNQLPSYNLGKVNTKSHLAPVKRVERKVGKLVERETMIERLMKTTTRDPTKKSPGDQGVEYSEYYNDDDVSNDPPGNKIQAQIDDDSQSQDKKSRIVRLERDITNVTSRNWKKKDVDNHNHSFGSQRRGNFEKLQNKERSGANPIKQNDASLMQESDSEADLLEDDTSLDGNVPDILLDNSDQSVNPLLQKKSYFDNPMNAGNYRMLSQQQIGFTSQSPLYYQDGYGNIRLNNPEQVLTNSVNSAAYQSALRNRNLNYNTNIYRNNPELIPNVVRRQQMFPSNFQPIIQAPLQNSASSKLTSSFIPMSSSSIKCNSSIEDLSSFTTQRTFLAPHQEDVFQKSGLNLSDGLDENRIDERQDEQQINNTDRVNETKQIADQILNKIVDELEELKDDRTQNLRTEGFPCRFSGSWVTSQAGAKLIMKVTNHSIVVTVEKLTTPAAHKGFLNPAWNVSGQVPFKRGGPFSLTGVDNKTNTLAVFVGSCRICQGIDTIEGIWLVSREPHGCRDFQMATSVYNDIFRRARLHISKREKHQGLLTATKSTRSTSTASSSTRKSESKPA